MTARSHVNNTHVELRPENTLLPVLHLLETILQSHMEGIS